VGLRRETLTDFRARTFLWHMTRVTTALECPRTALPVDADHSSPGNSDLRLYTTSLELPLSPVQFQSLGKCQFVLVEGGLYLTVEVDS
jgi:hypothetical protein